MKTLFFILSFVAGTAFSAVPLVIEESQVEFLALARPGGLKIRGKSKDPHAVKGSLQATPEKWTGKAKFLLDALETGISLRDRHMKDNYLHTAKHPEAELTIVEMKVPEALLKPGGSAQVDYAGTLRLHGVEKPVRGKADLKSSDSAVVGKFILPTKITDFAIEKPAFMGVSVDEDVEVTVEAKMPLPKPEAR